MTLVTELWAPNSWIWITKYPSQKLFLSIFFVFADWQSENKSAISSSVKTTNRGVSAMIVVCTIDSKREALVCFSIVRGASVYWPYNSIIRSVDAGAPGDLESYSWRIIAVVCQGLANHKRSIGFINIKRITIPVVCQGLANHRRIKKNNNYNCLVVIGDIYVLDFSV